MAELEPDEKHAISHRGRAARALARRRSGAGRAGRAVIRTKAGAAGALGRLERAPDRAQARRRRDHRLDRDHHRGDPLGDRPARLGRRLLLRPHGRRARRPRAPLRPREGREPRRGDRGHADPGRRRDHHLRGDPAARDRLRGRGPRGRHRRDRLLGGRQRRRLDLPLPARAGARVAGARGRRRAPAHRRDDLASACSLGLVLVEITGEPAFDAIAALASPRRSSSPGCASSRRSSRVLVDEAPPADELDRIEAVIAGPARALQPEIAGYHKLRARGAGAPPLHRPAPAVPVREPRSSTPTRSPTRSASAIEAEIPNSEVLIHTEPEESYHPPDQAAQGPYRAG